MDDNLPPGFPFTPCPEVKDLLKYKLEEINKAFLCCGGTRLDHLLIQGSSEETLQLLKKGADVNLRDTYGKTALMVAVTKKSISSDIVKIIAENTSDLNVIDIDGKAALHFAVSSGNFEAVQILLQFGANIDIQNRFGDSPLHTACFQRLDLFKTLVEHGANVGVKNKEGKTPLHLAVVAYKNGIIDVGKLINTIDILLDKGANINEQTKDGKTIMHILGRFWKENPYLNELHTFLLDKGAQVHLQDKDGVTPLYLAIKQKRQYLSLMLRTESGKCAINIADSQGNYPLFLATKREDFEMVRLLLDNGAVIDINNKFEETPLYIALKMGSEPILSLLIDRGAQVSFKDKYMRTPLHIATEERSSQQKLMCTTLLTKGASPNVQDGRGLTPLHNAVQYNRNDIVQLLLENGAKVNIKNKRGETPLHIYTRRGTNSAVQDLICSTLIEKEALIYVYDNDRMTPLHNAVTFCNTNIVLIRTIENGAEMNIKNKNEETPLHLSTSQSIFSNRYLQKLVCSALLVKGASPNAQDVYGMTPLHNAAQNFEMNLIHLLLENGADVNSKNKKGETPLHVSTLRCDDIDLGLQELTCSTLLAKGALINVQDDFGMTPLHNAVNSYRKDLAQLLLENGAELNIKNKRGESPIRCVYSSDTLEVLLQKGAEVNEQDNYGQTALHTLAKDYEWCRTNIKAPRRLWYRAECATSKVVKLLEWGASPNIRDNLGKLPFEYYLFTDALEEYEIKRTCLYTIYEIKKGSNYYLKFQWFHERCCEEVESMKHELLGKHSLYDIFRHYDDPNFLSNTELESAILSKDLNVKFPIYCSMLISTYRRSRERVQLFDHVTDILQTKLPFEVMRCILTFVDDDSLRNVIKAKEEFSVNGESDSKSATEPDLELNSENESDSEYVTSWECGSNFQSPLTDNWY